MRVVYNSFEGQYSDSTRVLYEALSERAPGASHVWLLDPLHARAFPPDVETVRYGSADSIRALEAADLVIANTHTDLVWSKRPRTVYLQVWHGTPLKRIHWDVRWAPPGRLERLLRDTALWDYLVSPNRASTPFLRQAFRFEGEVLETGYPRNDLLLAPEREAVRARVRRELGIADGTTAVLYTPTWRDDVVFPEGGKAFSLGLDVGAIARQLGDDHCLLLRLHYMLAGRLVGVERHPAVRDVSHLPDVSGLYLAADVLVTDYSSTMFDFAVTGKPMLFYAYDLAEYEGRLRGFYFDFAARVPGPVVQTPEDLVAALRDLPAVRDRYATRYTRFRATFCHLEDGRATERVLERLALAASPAA
jgi:CDP-glycerol glycerophosphotransferase